MSANRVYVNNLPYSVKEEGIAEFFSAAGTVSEVELFSFNGRSKGCALVTFETDEAAAKAIAELNEKELDGRALLVREDRGAREKSDFPAPVVLSRRPLRKINTRDHGRKIYVGNLPFRTEWHSLKDLFRDCGEVIRADIAKHNGRSRGYGTVVFATEEDAQNAIKTFNDTEFEGRQITVRLDRMTAPPGEEGDASDGQDDE